MNYDHRQIEPKWQDIWEKNQANIAGKEASGLSDTQKKTKKFYALIEFPFPSGDGLHVGHIRSNTAMDVIARKRRREGFDVLYPIGWDAFGLPTENYAIKMGIHPAIVTKQNSDTFRRQLKVLGFSFDWSREINTTDPAYYKWTQWIFLQFLKKGLAYKKKMLINWCPKDLIGLANEEVVDGCCERCGTPVEKREKEQWMLAITKYADRLHKDIDDVDFLERIKIQQRNWIGKSEGAEIGFDIVFANGGKQEKKSAQKSSQIPVFTTRPDTIYGVTYLVLSPEHPWVTLVLDADHVGVLDNANDVQAYVTVAKKKTEIERTTAEKEKTGVELKGVKAINPATKEEIPIWIADYVLADYGTGAVMAVPAHDERDEAFAKKYNLEIRETDTSDSVDAKKEITVAVGGEWVTKYKLRDWIFSRQRYWGEPIPVVHCGKCGIVPVPEKDLPVELPNVKNYMPTETGESPLAAISEWVNTTCPTCDGPAKRETDTMPNWAGSSWYYLRYTDPQNPDVFASAENLKKWTPVDWYNGGMEHTTLHLLYSRFWHKFLYDLKLVPTSEPYMKRTSHGLILASGGEKMSKSKGNVINPDQIVAAVGADALRLYEMFMGPFDQPIVWNNDNIAGTRRFIERVWKLQEKIENKIGDGNNTPVSVRASVHKTIKKVSDDIEAMRFNTAISALMILLNEFEKDEKNSQSVITRAEYEIFIQLIAPFAPHVAEEIWANLGHSNTTDLISSIHATPWPAFDQSAVNEVATSIMVQVNGKPRARVDVTADDTEASVTARALALPDVIKWTASQPPQKTVYIAGKLISFVV